LWFAYHATTQSIPEIGRRCGDRDHTTVLHAVRVVSERLACGDPETRETIAGIVTRLADAATTGGGIAHEEPSLTSEATPQPEPVTAPAPARKRRLTPKLNTRPRVTAEPFSPRWFAENDAAFRAAFIAAHPEFAPARKETP
jgi:hypothetical protein